MSVQTKELHVLFQPCVVIQLNLVDVNNANSSFGFKAIKNIVSSKCLLSQLPFRFKFY